MKTLNNTTKAAARFINGYSNSLNYTLSDCYGRYSTEKARAERWCKDQMNKENGFDFRIISFNTFGFSCGWKTDNGLRVETPQNSYFIPAEA